MLYESFIKKHKEEPIVCHSARDINLKPGATFGPVIRDVYLVECCTCGFGSVIINGKEFPIKPGDCYFLFPGQIVTHAADCKEPREGVWCAMDGLQIGTILSRSGISADNPFAPADSSEKITKYVEEIVNMNDENDAGADLRRTSLIYSILGELLRYSSTVADKKMYVQRAIGIMETRYNEDINVEDIAFEIGLDRSYFSTMFKARTGYSPYSYLTSLRIKKACTLMEQKEISVSNVAVSVGLDPRNFSRLFKREIGKSPLAYIKDKN